ncbi:rhomboid family-domain-containing protein [Piptocephalis cylindrospora]|uniref:Rhomboid-type serine protease n=1 Tax=Piptocephalis cylindrospora TaxID=1907219 RepID=A0A4P9Y0R2_9FUNG|nr:rhomboid family-domain-containing protein [Piptocephalis cylindrospora]|eukprot:RKP12386.1 rhomboid family-domain-containing protein [Piptocephalis cylindrospora]
MESGGAVFVEENAYRPYFIWITLLAQLAVFIVELVRGQQLEGSPIQTSPFNYMIGPGSLTLIQTGARFTPCMRPTDVGNRMIALTGNVTDARMVTDLCGFGGIGPGEEPNQGYRLFLAMFLHGGVIHILFNSFAQWRIGIPLERVYGWWRILIICWMAGVGGNAFGGLLSPPILVSVGASGAVFGLVGALLVELILRWREMHRPGLQLFSLLVTILINLALGLLPGIDNFAHIGGLLFGLITSFALLPSRILVFRGYRNLTILSIVCALASIGLFIGIIAAFFQVARPGEECSWCKYLSCLPIAGGCDALTPT